MTSRIRQSITNLGQDVRFAWRMAARRPAFAAAAAVTLTFGIGASTAIFTIADRTLLQPLPYPDSNRIVVLDPFAVSIHRDAGRVSIQPQELKRTREFEALGFYEAGTLDLAASGDPIPLQAAAVDSAFFEVLAVSPLIGGVITPRDDGGRRVAVLSFETWHKHFSQDGSIVGRSVRLSGQSYTVLGVMPKQFAFPSASGVWISAAADRRLTGGGLRARAIGRLAAGVTIPQATAMLANVKEAAFGERQGGPPPSMSLLQSYAVSHARPTLLFLMGLVSLLLTAASASVASLLLSRVTPRLREMHVRTALGASKRRLIQQLVVESLVIAAAGAAGGTIVAVWIVGAFSASSPLSVAGVELSGVDARLLAIGAAVSVASSALFSLVPIVGLSANRLGSGVRFGVAPAVRRSWLSRSLLTSQMAVALVLLVATSTALAVVIRLTRTELGLHNRAAVTFEVALPPSVYPTAADITSFATRLETTLRSLPGVRAVGLTDFLPGSDGSKRLAHLQLARANHTGGSGQDGHATLLVATHDYFRAAGVPLLAGRFFNPREGSRVVVLNETAARVLGSDIAQLVGRRLTAPDAEIVGVVGDVQLDVDVPPAIRTMTAAHVYRPLDQEPIRAPLTVVVDMAGEFAFVAAAVRKGLREVDPQLAIYNLSRVGDLPARIIASERLIVAVGGLFSLIVLMLAATGLYGVLAQLVTERTREIGIRLALGASPRRLRAGVVGIGIRYAVAGMAIGAALASAIWSLASAAIPKLDAPSPRILAIDGLVLLVVAVLAAWLPARRASSVDPVVALKAD